MDSKTLSKEGGRDVMTDKITVLDGVLQNLFDCLGDKDVTVRHAVQTSLISIMCRHPLRASEVLTAYREKNTKLPDETLDLLLAALEKLMDSNANIPFEAYEKFVTISLQELSRAASNKVLTGNIQKHAKNVLVAIGCVHCSLVVDALMTQIANVKVAHHMVIRTLGCLASLNVQGIVPHTKQILSTLINHLGVVDTDYIKESYVFSIGRLCEAILEYSSSGDELQDNMMLSNAQINYKTQCETEICVAHDIFLNNWMQTREQNLSIEILSALTFMYPLLPNDKIIDQTPRLIPQILALFRRSIERNAVTLYLVAVLKTNIAIESGVLDALIDNLISNLFDLVCVYPDYEKPQTVKGHYEVLRCFHLLCSLYAEKIMETLIIHLRNNSERERIKSLLVLNHLLNTSTVSIENKLPGFIEQLKQMVYSERSIKMKMTLLKTIVALAQKSFIKEKEFVYFIVRYSCKYLKINQEHGSLEEHANFVLSCQKSLCMLSTTVGTMDDLLKRELLNYFVLLDYTDICSIITKCLWNLFAKSSTLEPEYIMTNEKDNYANSIPSAEDQKSYIKPDRKYFSTVPTGDIILARCLALLGNYHCIERSTNILNFLKYYHSNLHRDLHKVWDVRISDLLLNINKESVYFIKLNEFITETTEFLTATDVKFSERLVTALADHIILYPITLPHSDFLIPTVNAERNMLLKAIALTLCSVTDVQLIHTKIDLIITIAKMEKLDKHIKHEDYENKINDASLALGYISHLHYAHLIKKLAELAHIGARKQSTGFFSNFIKDTNKELENYKINLLVVKTFEYIMQETDPLQTLQDLDDTLINFLLQLLTASKSQVLISAILRTLLSICNQIIATRQELNTPFKYHRQIMDAVISIPISAPYDDLPILPIIIKLYTKFISIERHENGQCEDETKIFGIACKHFFNCAQHLRNKFDSPEEDERNSFLAKHLNESLPELNTLVKVIIEMNPVPATLDSVIAILDAWTRDRNSEVRICASHVYNNALSVYIKSMKIGCEFPSRFNQTGQMLGKIVPRCIDSNGTVRQVSVEILQKILEISTLYETRNIVDSQTNWVKEIEIVKEKIVTDDPKKIYMLAGDIAKIIAVHMQNFDYLSFCKLLLEGLNDNEHSSAIGASVVLKFCIQQKGAELFYTISDIVQESLNAIKTCQADRAKSGVLKALVALAKHHPKLVCAEMLKQKLPFEENVAEFWHLVCNDLQLTGVIIENFIQLFTTTPLFELKETVNIEQQKIATFEYFAIICALKEMIQCKEIKEELLRYFPELFVILLTTLAVYIQILPPSRTDGFNSPTTKTNSSIATIITPTKNKVNFVQQKEALKLNPCQMIFECFYVFLQNTEMTDMCNVINAQCEQNALLKLSEFVGLLTPLVNCLVDVIQINSKMMKLIITELSPHVSSPCDEQRMAAIGFLSRIIPLKPMSDILSTTYTHLNSALSDPNAAVRGLSIQGLAYVAHLHENDIEQYTDATINALLKGIDDTNTTTLVNIPLESMRGLSRILKLLPSERVELFHVSLAIRIRPFFGSYSLDLRESAIILFGDLCESKITLKDGNNMLSSTEALREQLLANLFPLLLHLSEGEPAIIKACKWTLKRVCALLDITSLVDLTQRHLTENAQFNFNNFTQEFVKLVSLELPKYIQDFIDSCVPKLRSQWPEVRGSAAIVIGLLNNHLSEHNPQTESVGNKISSLLKDENHYVRVKAATALGHFFGDF